MSRAKTGSDVVFIVVVSRVLSGKGACVRLVGWRAQKIGGVVCEV